MKICFICNQVAAWGKIGGFGTNTRRLGRALAVRGHDIHVVVPRRASQGRCEQLDGMTVHGLSNAEVFFGTSLYREIGADVFHVEEPNICGYWAQEDVPNGIHLVTSMDPRDSRDWWIEFSNATWSRRLKYPIQRYYEDGKKVHCAVRRAQGVYVEAEFLKPKTQRLYNLPDVPGFDYPLVKADRPICVFLGRFDPRKRPELFFQLVERMPDIDFVAIGAAHDRPTRATPNKAINHIGSVCFAAPITMSQPTKKTTSPTTKLVKISFNRTWNTRFLSMADLPADILRVDFNMNVYRVGNRMIGKIIGSTRFTFFPPLVGLDHFP